MSIQKTVSQQVKADKSAASQDLAGQNRAPRRFSPPRERHLLYICFLFTPTVMG